MKGMTGGTLVTIFTLTLKIARFFNPIELLYSSYKT